MENQHCLSYIRTAKKLYDLINKKIESKQIQYYVFLEEVQQVDGFQEAVDWLYVKENVDLYITGSNAFLLSGELATLLSGRYVEIKMQPLSLKEYVAAHPDKSNTAELYMDYLTKSSFPGTLELEKNRISGHIWKAFTIQSS